VRKYSDEFKLTAVRLSQQPGLQVKSVAAALTIHPFMLSKWRKDARDGCCVPQLDEALWEA
jgi:transposase